MKKILGSLVCVGMLYVGANAAMVSADFLYSKYDDKNSTFKLEDKDIFRANFKIQSFKNSDNDNPAVGSFRLGVKGFESNIMDKSSVAGKETSSLTDFDIMFGYGFYTKTGDAKIQTNILGGFYHANYELKQEANLGYFITGTNGQLYQSVEYKVKTNALKFGVSTIVENKSTGAFFGVDAFLKHYLGDERAILLKAGESDSNTKFEIDGLIGYKFSKDDNGFIIGLKAGYANDLLSKGGHFGLSLGYVF